jgi:hypothetical protein
MRVGGQIERHVVDEDGEVCAVVQIEAAKEVLIRLPTTGMLRDDEARNGLKHFTRPEEGAILQFRRTNRPLRGGVR